jgi:hypothetical protein
MDFNFIIKDVTTVSVLFLLFLLFYSKFKKQSIKESFIEIKEGIKEIFGSEEE